MQPVPHVVDDMYEGRDDKASGSNQECRLVSRSPVPELEKANAERYHAYHVHDIEPNNHPSIVTRLSLWSESDCLDVESGGTVDLPSRHKALENKGESASLRNRHLPASRIALRKRIVRLLDAVSGSPRMTF